MCAKCSDDGHATTSARHRFFVLDGWLARSKCLRDGRRQIIGFYLPGDVVCAMATRDLPIATSVAAVDEVVLCPAPEDPDFMKMYANAAELDQSYLYRQVVRLGRMSAFERVSDWMLEMRDRLLLAGMAQPNCFRSPITQELLGDILGLTVHVNRTLKSLREARVLTWRSGNVRLFENEATS
ncbi:Crp/Fnr family transcriptional regulator [Sphingomonas sp. RS6]